MSGRLKGFEVNATRLGRTTQKKLEGVHKKKLEEEQTQEVFKEFVAAFEGDSKTRTWIKGGVVNSSGDALSDDGSRVYKPVSKIDVKNKTEDVKTEVKKVQQKPPALGKRKGQEQKKSKLEQFKEELKLIQQQREQRHAMRQGKSGPPPPMIHSELDLSDVGNRGRDYSPFSQSGSFGSSGGNGPYNRRLQRDRRDDYPYDFDGDHTTTNLFLGNLNPKMTEQQLCEAFGRYGPLASVKIMWPRTEEERCRGRNCGFVAFMNRRDGERALENIRGKELMGFEMKLGWGKSVPIPLYPIYIPPPLLELVKPPPPSGLPFNAQPREWLKSLRSAVKERAKLVTDGNETDAPIPPGSSRKPFDVNKMTKEELTEVLKDAIVKVVIPSDRSILALIHRLIEFVVLEGPQFEAAIMHREQNNPQFKFLFDYQSSEHVYYRWKLWSILHGESVNNWKTDEFRMFEGGPLWRPPPMNLFTGGMPEDLIEEDDYPYAPGYVPLSQTRRSQDSMHDDVYSEDLAASRRCGLTEAQRGRFTQMLVDLEPSQTNIGDVMVWCLEHADSAADIADCVVEAITSDTFGVSVTQSPDHSDKVDDSKANAGPSIPKLVARLFLISDILYNSSAKVPNASFFRNCFESRLPEVFKSMHSHYKNVEGKLKAEQLKQKVMLCFRAWEDWAVYPNDYLIKLQNIFLGLVSEVDEEADLAGVPLDLAASEVVEEKILDGKMKHMDSDVEVLQAQPLVQYDGDPLDVDGSPLENDDVENPPSRPTSSATDVKTSPALTSETAPRLFVPSKWETVDPEIVESEAVTTMSRWELLVDPVPKQSLSPNNGGEELRSPGGGRWNSAIEDDDLDGQPLTSLVAYDDEDAASASDTEVPEIPLPSISEKRKRMSDNSTSSGISEERRNRLREIELKVLKYQDELESRRKGDKSVTEQAIAKQIQRYRERLLERMQEDEANFQQYTETSGSKHTKERTKLDGTKRIRRDHSVSPPASTRDFRDRSPPRSFRDRPRRHPVSPSSTSLETYNVTYDSPRSSAYSRYNYDQEVDDDHRSLRKSRIPSEELEEGEASDEEDPGLSISRRNFSKRPHMDDGNRSPTNIRKRQRSRSRSPRHYRSRTPSPTRRRSGPSMGSTSHRRK